MPRRQTRTGWPKHELDRLVAGGATSTHHSDPGKVTHAALPMPVEPQAVDRSLRAREGEA